MNKLSKILLATAAVLLVFSGVEGTKAALNIKSDVFEGQLKMPEVHVVLTENGKVTEHLDALDNMIETSGSAIVLGKSYDENIGFRNEGTIKEYIRATVVTYWEDENGKKTLDVDPRTIQPHIVEGWNENKAQATAERSVYYRATAADPTEEGKWETLIDTFKISPELAAKIVIDEYDQKAEYAYNNYKFVIEVTFDAVQAGGQKDTQAIKSSWGIDPAGLITLEK